MFVLGQTHKIRPSKTWCTWPPFSPVLGQRPPSGSSRLSFSVSHKRQTAWQKSRLSHWVSEAELGGLQPRSCPTERAERLALLGACAFPRAPLAHSQARHPASPDPLMNTKEIKDDAIRWNVCFAALKSLRKMKTHTRKLYEANFTED